MQPTLAHICRSETIRNIHNKHFNQKGKNTHPYFLIFVLIIYIFTKNGVFAPFLFNTYSLIFCIMKKFIVFLFVAIATQMLFAQSPQSFRYQAVVRNAAGTVIQTQNVSLKISLLQGSATGTVVYSEEHAATTNTFGLVNLEIGSGANQAGTFAAIDWSFGPYFIKIEMDATGGSMFTEMGTTQLMSVPYALYAASGTAGPQGPAGVGIQSSYVFNDSLYLVLSNAQVLNTGHVRGLNGIDGINGINGVSVTNTYVNNDSLYIILSNNITINAGHVRGAQGMQGATGNTGTQGPQGEQGLAGIGLNNRGAWLSGTNYNPNDYVFDRSTDNPLVNSMWICQSSSSFSSTVNPYQDAINWVEFQAPAGQDGLSIVWLGSFTQSPISPNLNDAYYNSTDKISYVWSGSSWEIIAQDGAEGAQGAQGEQGTTGANGINGLDGKTVLNGTIDPTTEGTDGDFYINTTANTLFGPKTAGAWGVGVSLIGPQGTQGIQGLQGAAGTGLTNRGNWLNGTEYNPGDYVFDRSTNDPLVNSMWISENTNAFISTTQPYLDAANWAEFQAPEGPQGLQGLQGEQGVAGTNGLNGISISWQGTLATAPVVPSLNMAYYNSTDKVSYIYNGTTWEILAQDGADGATGASGSQGEQGEQGIPGAQGEQGIAGLNGSDGISISWQGTLATAPGVPSVNMAYYNSTDKISYIYNGTSWETLAQDGAIGTTGAQGSPGVNGLDGISISWQGTLLAAPATPTLNMAYYNSTDKKSFIYNGTSWEILTQDGADGVGDTYSAGTGLTLSGSIFNSVWTSSNTNIFNNNTGFVGIGTNDPLSSLHLQGSLRINDDTEGAGKVLTSDAVGNATWQTPAAGGGSFTGTGIANYIPKFSSSTVLDTSLMYQTGKRLGVGTTTPSGRFMIQQDAGASDTEPIFEIKDKGGFTVMVIYKDSMHFYVNDPGGTKAQNRGAFAVSGKNSTKGLTNNYLLVNPDSTRIYTSDTIAGFGVQNIGVSSITSYMKLNPTNYFIGHNSGESISDGKFNSTLGYESGNKLTTGDANCTMGYKAGNSINIGDLNVFIGNETGLLTDQGYNNTAVGSYALHKNTVGYGNVAIGYAALKENDMGVYNSALGMEALMSNTNGSYNTSCGYHTLKLNTEGAFNSAIGSLSMENNISGYSNTALGAYALNANTTGNFNTGLGATSLRNNTTGSYNVAVGSFALRDNISGEFNVAIGDNAMMANTIGINNTAVGAEAMKANVDGNRNTAIGDESSLWNETGDDNTSVGYRTLILSSGNGNTAIGSSSMITNAFGWDNTALGHMSLFSNTNGTENVACGKKALYSNVDGSYNSALGMEALYSNSNGIRNTAMGYRTLYSNTSGTYNVAMGALALNSNTDGISNIAIGRTPAFKNTTGDYNIAIGTEALYENLTNDKNIAIGYYALQKNTANNNIATGHYALQFNTTGTSNTAYGYSASRDNTTGGSNTAIGYNALLENETGQYNVAVGFNTLASASTTGSYNIAIGTNNLRYNTTGGYNTCIGTSAMYYNTSGSNIISIGYNNLNSNSTGSSIISVGNYAMYNTTLGKNAAFGNYALYSNTAGTRNIAIGDSTLYAGSTNSDNIAIGYTALKANLYGSHNLAFGIQALYKSWNGSSNVAVGNFAGKNITTGYSNTAFGDSALYGATSGNACNNTAVGNAALSNVAGDRNTSIGCFAAKNLTGTNAYDVVAIGYNSGPYGEEKEAVTIGSNSRSDSYGVSIGHNSEAMSARGIAIGHTAYSWWYATALGYAVQAFGDNSTAIGNGTMISDTEDNQIKFGNTSITSIKGQVGFTTYSDARVKNNVQEDVSGLAFIKELRPVTYNYDIRKENEIMGVKESEDWQGKYDVEKIRFSGFLAQEVDAAAKKTGYNFSGVDKSSNLWGLRYSEFVVPIVKSVQEQQTIIENQQKLIDELMRRIEVLEKK
ncbi:MAG: hypothetical protein A2491_01860 [Bacteroidetes bacterium RIFOXYC12_FULL_35_7]|nr:MAG: hypothetical protein A2491_01860 [Bacteroidetes bacterium RIFOXYC12_FULL_35_7]